MSEGTSVPVQVGSVRFGFGSGFGFGFGLVGRVLSCDGRVSVVI